MNRTFYTQDKSILGDETYEGDTYSESGSHEEAQKHEPAKRLDLQSAHGRAGHDPDALLDEENKLTGEKKQVKDALQINHVEHNINKGLMSLSEQTQARIQKVKAKRL